MGYKLLILKGFLRARGAGGGGGRWTAAGGKFFEHLHASTKRFKSQAFSLSKRERLSQCALVPLSTRSILSNSGTSHTHPRSMAPQVAGCGTSYFFPPAFQMVCSWHFRWKSAWHFGWHPRGTSPGISDGISVAFRA